MKLTCAPFWRLSCFTRKIKRLRSIQVSFAALLFSLSAFSDLFRWLLFEEAFIKVMKLSVSFLEADCVHLFHLQLCFFSQWNTGIEVYAVYRWAVAFFRFFDLFCRSVMITSIRGSIHQGHEASSEHSRGRQCVFMSLSALLFNRSDSVESWTQTDIDAFLFHGDRMYLHALTNEMAPDTDTLSINV